MNAHVVSSLNLFSSDITEKSDRALKLWFKVLIFPPYACVSSS
jgi:hypothetical protein